jgi:hypothetical protein
MLKGTFLTRTWLRLLNGFTALCFLYGRVWVWARNRPWPTREESEETARFLGLSRNSPLEQPRRGTDTIQ